MSSYNKIAVYLIFVITIFEMKLMVSISDIEPLKMGNLALSTSQQPGPLIGFGQNIVDKGDLQLFSYINYLHGTNKNFTEVAPYLLYGFTDKLSLFLELPIAAKFQQDNIIFRGIEQLVIQFEYVLYEKNKLSANNQITLVANISLSNNSIPQHLTRATESTNFFLGFTASHMGINWYPFVSAGLRFGVAQNNTKSGNQFLYNFGIARNIAYASDAYIFDIMLELDGIFRQQDQVLGNKDRHSGGNTILLGPSIWFSTQRFILQAGISGIIFENLASNQNKNKYYASLDCGWKF